MKTTLETNEADVESVKSADSIFGCLAGQAGRVWQFSWLKHSFSKSYLDRESACFELIQTFFGAKNNMVKKFLRLITTQRQRIFIANLLHKVRTRPPPVLPKKNLSDFERPFRLHLGCGNISIPGYCNVDVMHTVGVDIVDDIRSLAKFPIGSAREIYACHVLEHFAHDEIIPILKRWFDVLMPGGVIRISVPDLDRIVKIYADNPRHFNTPGHSPWIGLIYGGQSTPYDYHKTGFNFCWLKHLMEQCGFEAFIEYPHEPHFVPGVIDASMAKAPFGVHFSLNMMARKPG